MKSLIRSDSEVFNQWADKVHKILSQVPLISANGHMPLEYGDDEFQNCMRKLQQCALKFDDMPIYIINEKVSSELCYDQLKGMEDDERSDI